jgi:hypothetical protein
MLIPELDLTTGQVGWVLNAGAPAPRQMLNQLNYLRQLGIPFSPSERNQGRGHRLRYDFDHLMETGLALYALRIHLKPADIQELLVTQREDRRAHCRQALREQPEAALTADWVRSAGAIVPTLGNEIWMRMHDRYAEKPGQIDILGFDALTAPEGFTPFDLVERFHGQQIRGLVPLTRLVVQWTALALEAPAIRPGPKV